MNIINPILVPWRKWLCSFLHVSSSRRHNGWYWIGILYIFKFEINFITLIPPQVLKKCMVRSKLILKQLLSFVGCPWSVGNFIKTHCIIVDLFSTIGWAIIKLFFLSECSLEGEIVDSTFFDLLSCIYNELLFLLERCQTSDSSPGYEIF